MKIKYFLFASICLAYMNIAEAEAYQCPDSIVIQNGQAQIPGPAIFILDAGTYVDGTYTGGSPLPAIRIDENGTVSCPYKAYINQQKYIITIHTLSGGYSPLDPLDWISADNYNCKYVSIGSYCPFTSSSR